MLCGKVLIGCVGGGGGGRGGVTVNLNRKYHIYR